MEPTYNWQSVSSSQSPSFKIESTRNLGWWILLALLISVIVHVALYLWLGKMQWSIGGPTPEDIVWQTNRKQVSIDREKLEEMLPSPEPPAAEPKEPAKMSDLDLVDKKLDEFDLLERAKDKDVKLTPEVDTAKIFTNERPAVPKQALAAMASDIDTSAADVLSRDLKEMRDKLLDSSVVSNDQPLIELNNDGLDKGVDTDEFFKSAAAKAFGKGADKFMEGYSSLDGLIGRTGGDLPPGEEKILMPTDILFEYNQHELKEAARLSMMKLAFIVQTNPTAQFVIEGHTDTFGNDEYNLDLSMKRAVAVRDWLVRELRLESDNIKVMGLGKARPIVKTGGTVEEQALNRRVEIVIRKS
jgi:outer membrane protein OmpA-like peptidoglycan-associated protein